MPDMEQATVRRISWRLMPLLGLLYLVAYIDRQNISYAKLQMVDALGLSEAAFGLGASLFFIGYFLFEVPSNILLHRMGAHIWFTRIIASWGVVTILLAFTPSAPIFYLLRFLLGVAEAGFFPGVLYVLTLWFPARYRARAVGLFMLASAVANAVGGAIGGWLLDQDGALGLAGWQWVFLATGLPAVLLAPVVFFLLPRAPGTARWLSPDQKSWLAAELAVPAETPPTGHGDIWTTLRDGRVLLLCLVYIGFPLGAYGLSYWLPTIVRGFGVSNTANGLLNIIPWTLVAIALWGVPRHAARYRNPIGHAAGPALLGALLLVLSVVVDTSPCASPVSAWRRPRSSRVSPSSGRCRHVSSRAPARRRGSRRSIRSAIWAASSPRRSSPRCATGRAAIPRRCCSWPPASPPPGWA